MKTRVRSNQVKWEYPLGTDAIALSCGERYGSGSVTQIFWVNPAGVYEGESGQARGGRVRQFYWLITPASQENAPQALTQTEIARHRPMIRCIGLGDSGLQCR